jgi:hypothetical protein
MAGNGFVLGQNGQGKGVQSLSQRVEDTAFVKVEFRLGYLQKTGTASMDMN